jgi:hypothetical protein
MLQKGTLVAKHKVGIFFSTLVSDNTDLNCEGVVIHKARDGDRKLDHLFRSLFMTPIGTSQQFSVLNTKIRKHKQSFTKPEMGTGSLTTSSEGASP